jgi:signal transduction histidine kinase
MDSEPVAGAQPGLPLPGAPGSRRPGLGVLSSGSPTPGYPFRGPGLAARVLPFAVVAVLAEASLALTPGSTSDPAAIISAVLLAATAAAFALPWARLPGWAPVLVPMGYAGSVLALTMAAGIMSGVAIVALMPVVWTALFHRRWESACVLVATLVSVLIFSLVPVTDPVAVVARRLVFWGALGFLISVAAQGLRRRIQRSQAESARLQERLHEVSLLQDRDRIAGDLQDRVIQRVFTASLSLQAALAMTSNPELARRIEGVTSQLDEAIRLVRQSIFGLRNRPDGSDLRRAVLELCRELAPSLGGTPDVSFSGAIDAAPPELTAGQLLEVLRETLTAVGRQAGPVQVAVTGSDKARLTVTLPGSWPAGQTRLADSVETLREHARRIGAAIEVGAAAGGGTRLAWQLPGQSGRPGG